VVLLDCVPLRELCRRIKGKLCFQFVGIAIVGPDVGCSLFYALVGFDQVDGVKLQGWICLAKESDQTVAPAAAAPVAVRRYLILIMTSSSIIVCGINWTFTIIIADY
jgi:hypothetical protein